MGKGERTLSATKMDQSRVRAERENVEYVETLGVHWRNLSVHFKDVQALAPCSGDIEAGQAVALMGPTGCGKSTLAHIAAGVIEPLRGRVTRRYARHGMVFQDPRLLPWATAAGNILYPLRILRLGRAERRDTRALVS